MTIFTVEARRWSDTDHGGWDVTVNGLTIQFTSSANQSHGVSHECPLCGVTVTDWLYTTDKETNEKRRLDPVNHIAHVRFHTRIGDFPNKHWVVVERFGHWLEESEEYDNEPLPDQAFGPYPGEAAAIKAMEDSLLIEDACGDTKNPYQVTDCYTMREDQLAFDAERIIVDLTDPHHTGEEE